jgi:hypothetical protein
LIGEYWLIVETKTLSNDYLIVQSPGNEYHSTYAINDEPGQDAGSDNPIVKRRIYGRQIGDFTSKNSHTQTGLDTGCA